MGIISYPTTTGNRKEKGYGDNILYETGGRFASESRVVFTLCLCLLLLLLFLYGGLAFSEETTQTLFSVLRWTVDPVLSVSAWPKQSLESLAVSLLQKVESLAELLGYCMTLLRTCIHNPGYVCVEACACGDTEVVGRNNHTVPTTQQLGTLAV